MTGAKLKENVIVRGIIYFEVPPLNFDSEVYYDMVDWQKYVITKSPITKAISDEDLENLFSVKKQRLSIFPDSLAKHRQ